MKFEVAPQEYHDRGSEPQPLTPAIPQGVITNQTSILPSLTISQQQTPANGSPHGRGLFHDPRPSGSAQPSSSGSDNTAQHFFYQHHKLKRPSTSDSSPRSLLTDNLNDKLGPQYIQPRARINAKVPLLIIDPKKENTDVGLSGLKINRSSTNLATLGLSSNLSALSPGHSELPRKSPLTRNPFMLHNDSSKNSLVIAEEDESDEENYNELVYGRGQTKLAPFGGFSKPLDASEFFNQENIFETAPWKVVLTDKGNGSLTKAVKLLLEAGSIKSHKWVGTLSMPSDVVPKHVIDDIAQTLRDEYNNEAVLPNDLTFQGHYQSFCKQILWPTLHYQIPDDPKSKAFEDHSWGHYVKLNQLVADKVVEVYLKENGDADPNDPENVIWVHDYHLFLVPQMIREKLFDAKIGFFLHVSFPSSEVFRCFAQRKALLRGILGANSVAFQTEEYVRHFLQTCNRLLLADSNENGVSYKGRFTSISTTPVGIDANALSDVLLEDGVTEWRKLIRERWGDQHLIVSRDKLDKLRGIKQKLLAYEKFLHKHPEFVDTTVLIQICIGGSRDLDYEREVLQIADRINSLPDNISVSQPVVLLQKDIEFDQYLALQAEAAVFVVSSMREGLNLTCHEFILATTERKSPLMLSEFTGSSPLLSNKGKGALIINPWDLREFADTFHKALTMSPSEKLSRWRSCHDTVVTHDSKHWVRTCLDAINSAWQVDQSKQSCTLVPFTKKVFEGFLNAGGNGKRLFLINLETPSAVTSDALSKGNVSVSDPSKSSFSEPIKVSLLLSDLLADPHNQVYLMSHLKRSVLDSLYRTVPNLGLVAENGGYIKIVGSKKWVSIVNEQDVQNWLPQVKQLIKDKVERLPGSRCEVEDCTVLFDPGQAIKDDRDRSLDVIGDVFQHVNDVFGERDGVHANLIKNVVVIQQNQLALKALKFIISYYNSLSSDDDLKREYQVREVPRSAPATPTKDRYDASVLSPPLTQGNNTTAVTPVEGRVHSVFFGGGSTAIDEPSFEYLENSSEFGNVLTVTVVGNDKNPRASAHYSVSGKNELLKILQRTTH